MRWRIHGTRPVYANQWLRLRVDDVELPDGARIDHYAIEFAKPSVGAVVTDEHDRLLLLWRHRHITDASGWEIPAGWVEAGEDPIEACRREIEEETGYRAEHLEPLSVYHPLSGISTMTYTLYRATDVSWSAEPDGAETERVAWFTAEEARALLRKDLIPDGPTLTAVALHLAVAD